MHEKTGAGERVFINMGCKFQDQGGITIDEGALIGHNVVLATIITGKYCHHLPEYRQVKRFEAIGLKLSTTSIRHF